MDPSVHNIPLCQSDHVEQIDGRIHSRRLATLEIGSCWFPPQLHTVKSTQQLMVNNQKRWEVVLINIASTAISGLYWRIAPHNLHPHTCTHLPHSHIYYANMHTCTHTFLLNMVQKWLQWNPSITDTIGNQHFVPYRPFQVGVASKLATAIYVAMATPILYNNSYSLNDSNLKCESYWAYSWFLKNHQTLALVLWCVATFCHTPENPILNRKTNGLLNSYLTL